jgi:fructose-1,6-bisphosphatase I
MGNLVNLQTHLANWSGSDPDRGAIAKTVLALAGASIEVARLIARGPLAGSLAQVVGGNTDGDVQKLLDVVANKMFIEALGGAPVAVIGSEENGSALILDPDAPLAVAIDPLDGSSNIETNVSVGTIFSILPAAGGKGGVIEAAVLQPGSRQLAAGFVIYGPQTALVLTLCRGTFIFTLDPDSSHYLLSGANLRIPAGRQEYAINAANYCRWEKPVRAYIDDCISNDKASTESNFNMRWIASLVAETYRIIVRGGIFLYPRDNRPGYENGRIRLVYEANPIALLIEQAGGMATDGTCNILDIEPDDLHQRVPLIFGASEIVERVADYHTDRNSMVSHSPLFAQRGLFRG